MILKSVMSAATVATSAVPASPNPVILELVEQLVGFPTVSSQSNLGLIEWVRDYLAIHGVTSQFTYDASGKKANLFATLGGGDKPGLILSGHTDVVPVEGQHWHTEPFQASLLDHKLFGRGTADMKGFIGCALAMVPEILDANLPAPVHLALSYDEEVGCLGVRGLIADLQDRQLKVAGCIVGEPTSMQPVIAHKGTNRFRCCVRGREAHSSYTTLGVNAIEYAARLIVFISDMATRLAREDNQHTGFTLPYTTLQTGLIRGGIAANIVPRDCEFMFDMRTVPSNDPQTLLDEIRAYANTLLPAMRAIEPDAAIELEWLANAPGLSMEEDAALTQLVKQLTQTRHSNKVSYGTEAGLFQQAGIPTIVCGPGSIEQAHRPNEFVELSQLAACEHFLRSLLQRGTLSTAGL